MCHVAGVVEARCPFLIACCAQGRYQLDDTSGADQEDGLRVRAVQGHSIELPNPLHDPIEAPHEVPCAVHATSEQRCVGVCVGCQTGTPCERQKCYVGSHEHIWVVPMVLGWLLMVLHLVGCGARPASWSAAYIS